MAKASDSAVANETPAATPRKRVYGKKIITHAPVVDLEVGQSIEGTVTQKTAEVKTKYGPTPKICITLLEDFRNTKNIKKGDKVKEFKAGEVVAMFVKAGLIAAMEIPEGTACRITCTGTVPSDKGNDAYTFDVECEE